MAKLPTRYKHKGLMTQEELRERYKSGKALALSIEKWTRAGYKENWEDIQLESISSASCGLCRKYNGYLEYCDGCPLFKDEIRCGFAPHSWQTAAHAVLDLDRPTFMKARKNLLARMRRAYDRGER